MRKVLSGTGRLSYREQKQVITPCDSIITEKRQRSPLNSINIYYYLYLYTACAHIRVSCDLHEINRYFYARLRSFAPEYYCALFSMTLTVPTSGTMTGSASRRARVEPRDAGQMALKPSVHGRSVTGPFRRRARP